MRRLHSIPAATLVVFGTLCVGIATPALAQTAEQVLEDVDSFRAALGDVYGVGTVRWDNPSNQNVPYVDATQFVFHADSASIHIEAATDTGVTDTVTWATGAQDLAMPLRLLAGALGTGPISDVFVLWDAPLETELLGLDVVVANGGDVIVQRVGTRDDGMSDEGLNASSLAAEAGTSRPREYLTGGIDGYTVRIETYADDASGWYPERVFVFRGQARVLVFDLVAVAPDRADLPDVIRDVPVNRPFQFPHIPL